MTIKNETFRKDRGYRGDEDLVITSDEYHTDSDHEGAFSLDLESRCVKHFEFLKILHEEGVTTRVTSESLRRYLLWLNLLAKMHHEGASTSLVIPPKDVAWLWHCHRLAPQKYEEFLQETCVSAGLQFHNALKDPARDPYDTESTFFARETWAKYNPGEPFDLDPAKAGEAAAAAANGRTKETLRGFDLLASATSQAEFYWQIQPLFATAEGKQHGNRPVFSTSKAVQNYRRFLELLQKHPKLSFKLVPTYEIDLMWHTHMTGGSLLQYHSDCEVICGKLIDHDDSYGDGDRAEEGVLNQSFLRTAEFWSAEYKDDTYFRNGGYRGPPPANYYPISVLGIPVMETNHDQPASVDDVESPDVVKPSSADADTAKTPCFCSKKMMFGILFSGFILGILLFVLGLFVINPIGYYCGEAPTAEQIQARGAPVCLNTNVRDGPMCLQGDADPNSPAVWCQENTITDSSDASIDYFLWWSPCTKCGTAWRMYDVQDDDKSHYKLLEPDEPAPGDVPGSSGYNNVTGVDNEWLEWDTYTGSWFTTTIEIESCPMEDLNEAGIPSACFAPQTVPALWITGLGIFLISFFALVCAACVECCEKGNCQSGRSNGHYHTGGGACGGGGGGGGCGGGGCGGC